MQGNLLRGIFIWSVEAQSTVQIKDLAQQVLVTIFLYFNLKQKPLFTNNVAHVWFPFIFFFEKIIHKKDCNLEPFFSL